MSLPKRFKGLRCQCQFGGVTSARQANRSDDLPSMMNDMTAKIGKRAALANKIVDQSIASTFNYGPLEYRRAG